MACLRIWSARRWSVSRFVAVSRPLPATVIQISAIMLYASSEASAVSRVVLQANLNFIAKSFTTMMPTAFDRDIRFSMN